MNLNIAHCIYFTHSDKFFSETDPKKARGTQVSGLIQTFNYVRSKERKKERKTGLEMC